jgi:hypothetical protein
VRAATKVLLFGSQTLVLQTFDGYMATISPAPKFWFEADKITGGVAGNPLDTWQESSGSGIGNATGTSTARPLYRTNILNGLPAVLFDGVNDVLVTASVGAAGVTGANAATVYLVIRQQGAHVSNAPFSWNTVDPTNQLDALASYSDTLYWDHGNSGGTGRISVAQPAGWDDAWHLVKYTLGGGTGTITVDGVVVKSAAMSSNMTTGASAFNLGSVGATIFFSGDIYLVLGWGALLTVPEQDALTNLLAAKTGLLVSAP